MRNGWWWLRRWGCWLCNLLLNVLWPRDVLGPNIDRDWARWEDQYRAFDRWRGSRDSAGDWTTPAEELAYVKSWIAERLDMYEADGPI